jgi:hypothetical protein
MASYTEEQRIKIIDDICDKISEGRSLRDVLRDDNMPDRTSFFNWIKDNKERINQYARACEARADYIFDEMFEIADNASNDFTKRQIAEGVEVEQLNSEHIQRSRLRIDQRKWALSKMQPKKYGEKIEVENKHSGSIDDISGLSTEELIKRAEATRILSKSGKNTND